VLFVVGNKFVISKYRHHIPCSGKGFPQLSQDYSMIRTGEHIGRS